MTSKYSLQRIDEEDGEIRYEIQAYDQTDDCLLVFNGKKAKYYADLVLKALGE